MASADSDFDKLRLMRSANVGPVTYKQLISRFGSAMAALEALPELATRGGARVPKIADRVSVEREMERVDQLGAKYLFLGSLGYPALLAEIDGAPQAIIYRGNLELLEQRAVSIVGARNASAAACRFARELAFELAESKVTVVSGLARGIDTAAHKGALSNGTIAVIASGIDVHYPPENKDLQEQIASDGLLLAEQVPGTEPKARHFPFRNRIISGLSSGTIVVEAAPRSGSLITARLAGEQGRHVMAVPGSPLDPRSQGCNSLIREGAVLVQSASDVQELIDPFDHQVQPAQSSLWEQNVDGLKVKPEDQSAGVKEVSQAERQSIMALLSMTATAVDEIVRQSGLPAQIVQMTLLELELAGKLARHAGGKVSLKG